MSEPFEYAGIFNKEDGKIYDCQLNLCSAVDNPATLQELEHEKLQVRLQWNVRSKVESAIDNDRRNLRISEISSAFPKRTLDDARQYGAKREARRIFLEESNPSFRFKCRYKAKNLDDEEVLFAYISNPDAFEEEKRKFIEENQEEILLDFLLNDLVQAEYEILASDTTNPIHVVKKIMAAVKDSPAQTVNVLIKKECIDFEFKVKANEFRRDCQFDYNSWNIIASDRRVFEATFGSDASYTPKEIVRITYGKKVLYQV